jgi:transposase-like protein
MTPKKSKSIQKTGFRQTRHFSEPIKKQTVKDIEQGKCTVLEASRELSVSLQTVYVWVYKYSGYLQKNKTIVVQNVSESYKTQELEIKLREAEAALGRKQMELDILNKIIDLAGLELQIDIKKNFSSPALNGTAQTKK